MSATEVIEVLESLPLEEREKVYSWLKKGKLRDLWRSADKVLKDAPKLSEEEILNLPRVRPPGF